MIRSGEGFNMKRYERQFKETSTKLLKYMIKNGWEKEELAEIKKECLKTIKKLKMDQGSIYACLDEMFINSNFDSAWKNIAYEIEYDGDDELTDKEWSRMEKVAKDEGYDLSVFLQWEFNGHTIATYYMMDIVFPDIADYMDGVLLDAVKNF